MNSVDPPSDSGIAAFYDTNAGAVYTYCLSLSADSEIAENAFHRAMARAWRAGGGRVRAFTLARTECRMRGLRVPTPAVDDSDRVAGALARVFTRLPPRDAEAAELALRHGLGAADLAVVFGLPAEHAERLVSDARDLFVDALTAENHVGVAEGSVLDAVVRSPHPLARVAALMPVREPAGDLRGRVLADLGGGASGTGARRHVPAVLRPRPALVGRRGMRRLGTRSAAIACSALMAVGFVTALSRPSGVERVPAPAASRTVAAPPRPSPPVRVLPTRTHRAPATPSVRPTGHRPDAAAATHTPAPTRSPAPRHSLSSRDRHSSREEFRKEMIRMYELWRARQRARQGYPGTYDHYDSPYGR